MTSLADPTVLAALVTGGATVAAGWLAVSVKKRASRDDTAAKGLAAQIAGWGRLSDASGGQITELREQVEDLWRRDEERVKSIDALEARERECNRRLDEAERQHQKCERDNTELRQWVMDLRARVGDRDLPPPQSTD
jgi:predicted RNase H-like nuclease (RuvC/YqgF family)